MPGETGCSAPLNLQIWAKKFFFCSSQDTVILSGLKLGLLLTVNCSSDQEDSNQAWLISNSHSGFSFV